MVGSIKVEIYPAEGWLEPCLEVRRSIKTDYSECLVMAEGLLLAEDEKIIGRLEESPIRDVRVSGKLFAMDNAEYANLKSREQDFTFYLTAQLTPHAIDYIEKFKNAERFLREGIKSKVLGNVPEDTKDVYEDVLSGIEGITKNLLNNHLSKFIHLDTGKLLRAPLKEDAEYLLKTCTSIVRYLSNLSTLSST